MNRMHPLAVALVAALLAGPAIAKDTGLVFVSSEKDNAVTALDGRTLEVVKVIPTGKRPRDLMFSPDHTKLYAACGDSNRVDVIDVATLAVTGRIPVGEKLQDPMPFKLIVGADNLAANGITIPGIQQMMMSGYAVGDPTLKCASGRITSATFVLVDGAMHVCGRNHSIAEGENLEDAEVVINYDLPWTPLLLIQRIGRVDRPTLTERDVLVCNFHPGSRQFNRLVSLYRRLTVRSGYYAKLARILVFGEEERDFADLDERNLGLVRAFYDHGNLERLRSEYLPTSTCLIDRATAKEVDLATADRLPLGAQSAMLGSRAGTFVLLRVGEQLHSVFQDGDGLIEESPHSVSHEEVLRLIRAERSTPVQAVPHDFEATLDTLLTQWCQHHGVEREAVLVVCAEAVGVTSMHTAT